VAAPAFLSGEAKGGGQVYMVPNNALPQCGTQYYYSFIPSQPPLFPVIFLFSLLPVVPFHLSFIPISRPSPPLIQLGIWGSAVSSPSKSGQSPAAKCNLVISEPRNECFQTFQSGNLQCSLNSVIYFFIQ